MEIEEKEKLTQIVKLVQKDKENFELLYTHNMNRVYYWCYTILKDETLARDLAQESMIKIYYKFHTLKDPEAFTSWMYTLVRNLCYNYIRRHKQADTISLEMEKGLNERIEDETVAHLPQDSYDLQETKKLMVDLIKRLPQKQREVITLFYLAELKLTEISQILERDLGTVKSRLQLGRRNLEKEIEIYEKSHGTKLYATILLPFLGEILQEDANHRLKKQELKYNSKLYSSKNVLNIQALKSVFALKPLVIGVVSLSLVTLVGIVSFFNFNHENGQDKEPSNKGVSAFEKKKSNLYIKKIDLSDFPTRTYTEVIIYLKKEAENKKCIVEFNGKPVPFEKQGDKVIVKAKENGGYTVNIGGREKTFHIDQINPKAPELESVSNQGDYLELNISDEFNQINYEPSYVLSEGEKYEVTENHRVYGQFRGEIKVYLYNQKGQYVYYRIDLK